MAGSYISHIVRSIKAALPVDVSILGKPYDSYTSQVVSEGEISGYDWKIRIVVLYQELDRNLNDAEKDILYKAIHIAFGNYSSVVCRSVNKLSVDFQDKWSINFDEHSLVSRNVDFYVRAELYELCPI